MFTGQYPGPARITLSGLPGRVAVIKAFLPTSVRNGQTRRQRRAGVVSGTYPVASVRIEIGDQSPEEFRAKVRAECERLSQRFRCPVWDLHWGFAELSRPSATTETPFDDPIEF